MENEARYEVTAMCESPDSRGMTLNEYQHLALETTDGPACFNLLYPTMGLAAKAGEVAGRVSRLLRDKQCEFSDDDRTDIALGCGNVLRYAAVLANDLGFTLDEIARMDNGKPFQGGTSNNGPG